MYDTQQGQQRLLRLTSLASVVTATLLIIAKLVAWHDSGSVGLLASLVDSVMDAVASLINLFAINFALKPADDEHSFGHGKAESLAGLGQALLISASAIFLFIHGLERTLNPVPLVAPQAAIVVMLLSIVLTLLLLSLQRYTVKKTGSVAIKADSLHYSADLLTNISILAAIVLALYGWPGFDAIAGLVVAMVIFYSAIQVGNEALHHLLDRQLPETEINAIIEMALSDPEIHGVHEVRGRQSGPTKIIQLHIEMDGDMKLSHAHDVAVRLEDRLRKRFIGADITIHQDPYGLEEQHIRAGHGT